MLSNFLVGLLYASVQFKESVSDLVSVKIGGHIYMILQEVVKISILFS